MVDEKRKRLILHQFTQAAARSKQPAANLQPAALLQEEILPFIRKIERLILEQEQSQAAVFYWSSGDSGWLQPGRAGLSELSRVSSTVAFFSEDRQESADEFCFAVVSAELSVALYGHCTDNEAEGTVYDCVGSLDAQAVNRIRQSMAPYLEFIDPLDAHRLDASSARISAPQSAAHFMNSLQHLWGELKAPAGKPGAQAAAQAPQAAAFFAPGSESEPWNRIRNNYPYPIANPYRALDSITDAAEKYKEQLKIIENLLALLAGICLAISAQNEPRILSDLRDYVSHGVSMGHWREIIRKCVSAWKKNSTKEIALARAISSLRIELTEKGFGGAVEQLIRARNDFAHHRGPTAESQIEKETFRLAGLLKECLQCTDFLCEHPIRIVKAIDVLPSGVIKMICLKAVGDHPVLAQEELCLSRGFPKGQLILDTGESNWLSLYPFLTQDICSSCGTMEIYHLDKWRYEKDRIQVRSFERGHAQESTAISHVLKAIVPSVS